MNQKMNWRAKGRLNHPTLEDCSHLGSLAQRNQKSNKGINFEKQKMLHVI